MNNIKKLFLLANIDTSTARKLFPVSIEIYMRELGEEKETDVIIKLAEDLREHQLYIEAMMLIVFCQHRGLIRDQFFIDDFIGSVLESENKNRNVLHHIAIGGYDTIINEALNNSSNNSRFNFRKDIYGKTPLHYAAESGHLEIVKYLCEVSNSRELINRRDGFGKNSMHYAIQSGNTEIVKCLFEELESDCENKMDIIEFIADPSDSQSIIRLAAQTGSCEMLELVLQKIGNNANRYIQQQDSYDRTSLHYCVQANALESIKLLVQSAGDDAVKFVCVRDKAGETALGYAVNNYNDKIVEYLLEIMPIEIFALVFDKKLIDYDKTVAHYAAQFGRLDIIEYVLPIFLENKNINASDRLGRSILHYAAEKGDIEIVSFLLSQENIDPDLLTKHDPSPLVLTLKNHHYQIAELISQHPRTNINQKDSDGLTPIMQLAELELTNPVAWLLGQETLDLMLVDNEGKTILQRALDNNQYFIAKMLVMLKNESVSQDPCYIQTLLILAKHERNTSRRVFSQVLPRELDFLNRSHENLNRGIFLRLSSTRYTRILYQINNLLLPASFSSWQDKCHKNQVPALVHFLKCLSRYYQVKLQSIYKIGAGDTTENYSKQLFDEVKMLIDLMPEPIRVIAWKYLFNPIVKSFRKYFLGDIDFGLPDILVYKIMQFIVDPNFVQMNTPEELTDGKIEEKKSVTIVRLEEIIAEKRMLLDECKPDINAEFSLAQVRKANRIEREIDKIQQQLVNLPPLIEVAHDDDDMKIIKQVVEEIVDEVEIATLFA